MPEYKIRPATVLDAINITRLLRPVWEVNEEVSFPVFEKGAVRFVMDMIDRAFVLVADLEGRLVGTIAVVPFIPPWSLDKIMSAMWFHARPTFRDRDTLSLDLLAVTEKLLDERGLSLRVDASTGVSVAFIQALALRPGYHALGLGSYWRAPLEPSQAEHLEVAAAVA